MSPADAIRPMCYFSSCSIPNTHYHQTGGIMEVYTAHMHKHESWRAFSLSALQAWLRELLCLAATTAWIHNEALSLPRWHCSIQRQKSLPCRPPSSGYTAGPSAAMGSAGKCPGSTVELPWLSLQRSLMHVCTEKLWCCISYY